MEFSDVVRRRRMVRNFDPDRPLDAATLTRLLEHAVRAPSAGFSQGWDFLVLDERCDIDRYWAATTDPDAEPDGWLRGIRNAPALILCLSNPNAYLDRYAEDDKGWGDRDTSRWPVPYWDIDTGMAALLMLLTAVDDGLGAVFFGAPADKVDDVRSAFSIPQDRNIVGIIAVGHRAPDRKSPSLKRGRRGPETVAHRGRFGTAWVAADGAASAE